MHISIQMTIHILFGWVFVMHISVQMTIHILIGFCHAHICTNEYPFLCVWVFVMHISVRMTIHFVFVWVFVMHISVQMTIHFLLYGFLSCTFLYEWLSIFIWVFVMHISLRMTIHILFEFVFVVHISVRMTNHILFCIGFRHAHFCTNDYLYSFGFSVMYIFIRITICSQFLSNTFLLNGNSEFLGVFRSNVLVSPCAQCSPTLE